MPASLPRGGGTTQPATDPKPLPPEGARQQPAERLRLAIVEAHFNHRPQSWVSKADGRTWHGAQPIEECDRCLSRLADLATITEQVAALITVVRRTGVMGWCSQTHHEWLSRDAQTLVAIYEKDAKP